MTKRPLMPKRFRVLAGFRLLRTPQQIVVFDSGDAGLQGLREFDSYMAGKDYPLNGLIASGIAAAVSAGKAEVFDV